MNAARLGALLAKEWADLRRNRAALLPVVATAIACTTLPFVVTIGIPAMVGEPLSSDDGFRSALTERGWMQPSLVALDDESAAQAFVYQQFLVLFAIVPVVGAMTFASHSIISEKQARTLEPLLATPVTTTELLAAKIVASLVPSLVVAQVAAALYLVLIAAFSGAAVAGAILTPRALLLQLAIGPLAALVALELAVMTSSRVNDPRTAQQVGVLIIVPLSGLMIAQFAGGFWLTGTVLALFAAVLGLLAAILLFAGVRVFDREAILTRWK
jgi:ABC-2 type transport system permease protein